ncbi:hypothetical protein BGX28_009879 [Mortierella sp. GBA30]|nr:hypothetical protein BGX28_009879 [Mortierella sp. GBA30]
MSSLGERSAAELAHRYQKKAEARKRGAGSHQPAFRGFSLTKASDKSNAETQEVDKAPSTIVPTATRTTRQRKVTEVQKTTTEAERNDSTANGTGLTEKYQERFKARVRGTGDDTKQPERRRSLRHSGVRDVNPAPPTTTGDESHDTTEATSTRPSVSKPRPGTTKASKPIPDTQDTHPREKGPSARRTKTDADPRVSPGFKISWGKKATVIISETSSHSEQRLYQTNLPAQSRESVLETTHENHEPDFGGYDDDQMSGPTQDVVEQETHTVEISEPVQRREPAKAKRKPGSSVPTQDIATSVTKRGGIPGKRRRIINEEADENEDPLSISGSQNADRSKASNTSSLKKGKGRGGPATVSAKASGLRRVVSADATTTKETSGPLRQTTLMQLASKPAHKASSHRRETEQESDQSDSDFAKGIPTSSKSRPGEKGVRGSSKISASERGKGPSDKTVKNYKQLQIHCLKFWGPSTAVSRPATVSNQTIARQLPVEGERPVEQEASSRQKLVQGVLQIEEAPLSEMDVIAEAVREVVDKFIESIEDQAIAKDIMTFRAELETALIEQVDLLDDHSLLRASVKKATALKKELRVRLLETQRERQRTRMELKRVRASFEREERARRRLEETHKFLTDLEALREEVEGSDNEGDDQSANGQASDRVKTGLQSLIATVGSRCGGTSFEDSKDPTPGMLGTLVDFNRMLETMEKSIREMPRISKSQEVTPSTWDNDGILDSDDSDY